MTFLTKKIMDILDKKTKDILDKKSRENHIFVPKRRPFR